jgi:glucan 1,3-beta-glucosidase
MVSFSRVIGIYAAVLGTANALSLRLNGVNYDLRQGPDWDPNKCKSGPIIKDDLQHLQQITSHIRTYSLGDCDVRPVLTYAKDKNMKVWLGVWVSADEAVYMKEVETLESLLADGLIDDTVIGFNVGSEAVYRGDITAEQVSCYSNHLHYFESSASRCLFQL